MIKSELRKAMINKRSSMTPDQVNEKSKHIVDQIRLDQDYINASIVALFYPMKEEVNLLTLLEDQKTFLFPRVEKDGIHFYVYHQEMTWIKSAFGVLEPDGKTNEYKNNIDYMLAPALAISKDFYRVGYGKGYYDRFLSQYRPKKVMGVIYDFQEVETFHIDEYDQKLDGMIKG